jgi:hypothetical protein
VTAAQLVHKLGAPVDKWTAYDLATLTVIYQSLKRGEIRADEEFEAATDRVTARDITGTAPATPGPAAAAQPPADPPPAASPAPPAEAVEPTPSTEPGSSTREQYSEIWGLFTGKFGFGDGEKTQARQVCERMIGRRLVGGTMGNLSQHEAAHLMDVLDKIGRREDLPAEDAPKATRAAGASNSGGRLGQLLAQIPLGSDGDVADFLAWRTDRPGVTLAELTRDEVEAVAEFLDTTLTANDGVATEAASAVWALYRAEHNDTEGGQQ